MNGQIHALKNKAKRTQCDTNLNQVERLKAINRELHAGIAPFSAQIAKAASLRSDNERLSAIADTDRVVPPSPTETLTALAMFSGS